MENEVSRLALDLSLFQRLSERNAEHHIGESLRRTLEARHSRGSDEPLKSAFQVLVDVIEIDKARREERFAEQYDHFYPSFRTGFLWLTRRSPEAGLAYLKWEASLAKRETEGRSPQKGDISSIERSAAAREAMALYEWWTIQRPHRADPLEASGLLSLVKAECEIARENREFSLCRQGWRAHEAGACQCQPPYEPGSSSEESPAADETRPACRLSRIEKAWIEAWGIAFEQDLEDENAFSRLQHLPMGILRS